MPKTKRKKTRSSQYTSKKFVVDENFPIHDVIPILRQEVKKYVEPAVTQISKQEKDPFKVLISTVLSFRTKDETTLPASRRLFAVADTPQDMIKLTEEQIAELIYPVGFYRQKAKYVLSICHDLITKYNGKVPDTIEELLTLKGVGRKAANLVVTVGYGKPGICVDTHVHRISNRWGYVKTKNPDETEFALRQVLPKEYWIEYNELLVVFGQNVCTPISPKCSQCPISQYCKKIGVDKHR